MVPWKMSLSETLFSGANLLLVSGRGYHHLHPVQSGDVRVHQGIASISWQGTTALSNAFVAWGMCSSQAPRIVIS